MRTIPAPWREHVATILATPTLIPGDLSADPLASALFVASAPHDDGPASAAVDAIEGAEALRAADARGILYWWRPLPTDPSETPWNLCAIDGADRCLATSGPIGTATEAEGAPALEPADLLDVCARLAREALDPCR